MSSPPHERTGPTGTGSKLSTAIKNDTSVDPRTDYIVQRRLVPQDGELHVVRWHRADGRDVKHRYFRRRHDAEAFLARLEGFGKSCRMFSTWAEWSA